MTLDRLLEIIKDAQPADRERLADNLIPELSEEEQTLARAWVGEFIAALENDEADD
jgi:hypothetical protein